MNLKYKNIEDLRKAFYKKFPNSNIELIKILKNRKVKVKDKYGIYVYNINTILYYGITSIKCALDKTEVFINKAKEIHKEKYDYSTTKYKGALTKLEIVCRKHGEFEQLAVSHLRGTGCKKCGRIKRNKNCTKSVEDYIDKLNKIHNYNYTINEEDYINLNTSIPHFCKIQEEWFNMRPNHVLNGQVCRKCANKKISNKVKQTSVGWSYSKWEIKGLESKYFDSFKVYIIRCWNENEEFYKIGKTFQTIDRRFQSKKEMPYNWKVIKVFKGKAIKMSVLEQSIKKNNKENKYTPKIKFSGEYECYTKIKFKDA